MNTILPPQTLYWGRSPRWQPNITALAELPTDTRLVLVSWDEATPQALAALRQRLPRAQLVALMGERTSGSEVAQAMHMGFADVGLGEAHTAARLSAWYALEQAEDALRSDAQDRADLLALVRELGAEPELAALLRTTVLRLEGVLGIARARVVMLRTDSSAGDDAAFVVTGGENMMHLDRVTMGQGEHTEFSELVARGTPLVISEQLAGALSDTGSEATVPRWAPRSAVLFPLLRHEACVGALFLRGVVTVQGHDDRMMKIGELVAAVIGVALGRAMEQRPPEHGSALLARAGQLSHDLTQPLTALLGYAQMLRDGGDPAKAGPVLLREALRATAISKRLARVTSPEARDGAPLHQGEDED